MLSSTEALLSAICMSFASTLFMILVLSFEEIAEEGKDGTAVYQVSEMLRHYISRFQGIIDRIPRLTCKKSPSSPSSRSHGNGVVGGVGERDGRVGR